MPTVFLILLFTINISAITIAAFILLLLLLFYCCHQITVTTDKFLRQKSFSGVVELITQLLRLINILWLPLCQINKLGSYYPRRLLRPPTLVGHHLCSPSHSCHYQQLDPLFFSGASLPHHATVLKVTRRDAHGRTGTTIGQGGHA